MAIVQTALQVGPRWRPSPLIAVSMLAHGRGRDRRDLAETWPFVLGAIVGNHLLLGVAGLMPRSSLLGPNLSRLPAVGGAAGGRTDDRRRARSAGHAACARHSRPLRCSSNLFLRRRQGPAPSGPLPRDRASRPRDRKSQPESFLPIRRVRTAPHRTRRRSRPANRSCAHRRTATLLSPCGRVAQRVSRSGAGATRPAPRKLDSARIRHPRTSADVVYRRLDQEPAGGRHPALARRQCRAYRAPGCRSYSRSCHVCLTLCGKRDFTPSRCARPSPDVLVSTGVTGTSVWALSIGRPIRMAFRALEADARPGVRRLACARPHTGRIKAGRFGLRAGTAGVVVAVGKDAARCRHLAIGLAAAAESGNDLRAGIDDEGHRTRTPGA